MKKRDPRVLDHAFICLICGTRSPQPILCTRDECPTEITMHCAGSMRRH